MKLSFKGEGIQSESTQNYMNAGLNIPAKLIEVGFGKDKDGKVSGNLAFTFEGTSKENGGKLIHTVWLSNFDKEGEFNKAKTEKEFQAGVDRELSRIFHILTAFATEDQVEDLLESSGGKISKAFELVIGAMGSIDFKDTPLELKITLDKKGRSQFPTFPNFVRSEHTPGRNFRIDTKINKFTGLPNDIMSVEQLPSQPQQGQSNGFGGKTGGGFGAKPAGEAATEEVVKTEGGFGFGAGQKKPF